MPKKLLTISLLVSGREETTFKCLDSIKGILENLDSELILVDTGCGENLREKLVEYTDQVIPFTWCDDFAKARNVGLEQAQGEWFLFLDDDEWFEDVTPIINFFQSGEYQEYDQAVYKARNYSDLKGINYTDEWVSRMIRLEKDTRFEGRVHESLVPARGKCKKLDAFVHHYGYVFSNEEEKQKHVKRNVDILLKLLEEEPNNMRWPIQLVQEYGSMEDGTAMRQTGEAAQKLIQDIDKPFVNQCRGVFYSAVVRGAQMEKDYIKAEERCVQYLKDDRNTAATQCSLYALGAIGANESENYERAMWYGQAYFDALHKFQSEEKSEQEQIIEESIVLVKDAVSDKMVKRMQMLWAQMAVRLNRQEEFPEGLREKLIQVTAHMIDGRGDFLFLSEEIWEIAAGGILPLESMILELDFSQWMAMTVVLNSRRSPADWTRVREHLASIRTRADIRYDYMDMHDANAMLTADVSEKNYDEMCQLLRYYTDSNLRFAKRVYTDKAFEDGMEMLQESCRGAVWIEQMLNCGEQEWSRKLEYLKESAKAYPAIGETIKHFAKLLGEEQEKQASAAQAANKELLAMASQVKGQVHSLMEAGMYAEALPIVRQLRGMLPMDEELLQIEKELELKFS